MWRIKIRFIQWYKPYNPIICLLRVKNKNVAHIKSKKSGNPAQPRMNIVYISTVFPFGGLIQLWHIHVQIHYTCWVLCKMNNYARCVSIWGFTYT